MNHGYIPGSEVPEKLTAVSWQDGDHGQLAAVTNETSLNEYARVRIIANKHNAARSGVEQPADGADVFMLLKQQQWNVSRSPGFETPLGYFGGSSD